MISRAPNPAKVKYVTQKPPSRRELGRGHGDVELHVIESLNIWTACTVTAYYMYAYKYVFCSQIYVNSAVNPEIYSNVM